MHAEDEPVIEPLIALRSYRLIVLTAEEYESLRLEVVAEGLCGARTIGLSILAQLVLENESRYHEVVAIRAQKGTYPRGARDVKTLMKVV